MSRFPDPRPIRSDIIAIGNDLSVPTLRDAYRHGIFPWPHEGFPLPWFSPRRRTVLFFEEVHAGRSLVKARRRSDFAFTIDQAFDEVIRHCAAAPRPGQDGTWIDSDIIRAYGALHRAGDAHSIEVWQGEELAGGLYGVDAGGVFTGESMFHRADNASKLALLFAVDHFAARGASWLDCQVMTTHMAALGARDIPRGQYLDMLREAQVSGVRLF